MNKICTSIEQSKKLIKLGIDINTADMRYSPLNPDIPWVWVGKPLIEKDAVPAWSIDALMELMPRVGNSFPELCRGKETGLFYMWLDEEFDTQKYSNPIDAAFEMIIWLNKNGKI